MFRSGESCKFFKRAWALIDKDGARGAEGNEFAVADVLEFDGTPALRAPDAAQASGHCRCAQREKISAIHPGHDARTVR